MRRSGRLRVLAQVHLLRSVLWWYLLPLGIGVVMLFSGARSPVATTIYAAIVAAVYLEIYYLRPVTMGPRPLTRPAADP